MVQALFSGLLNFFYWILNIVGTIIFLPIQGLCLLVIPDASALMQTAMNFFNTYIFNMIAFSVQIFENITLCPHAITLLLCDVTLLRFAVAPTIRAVRFIYNLYQTLKGYKHA